MSFFDSERIESLPLPHEEGFEGNDVYNGDDIKVGDAEPGEYEEEIKKQQAELKEIREAKKKALEAELEVRRRAIEGAPIDEPEVIDTGDFAQENIKTRQRNVGQTPPQTSSRISQHGFVGMKDDVDVDGGVFAGAKGNTSERGVLRKIKRIFKK